MRTRKGPVIGRDFHKRAIRVGDVVQYRGLYGHNIDTRHCARVLGRVANYIPRRCVYLNLEVIAGCDIRYFRSNRRAMDVRVVHDFIDVGL